MFEVHAFIFVAYILQETLSKLFSLFIQDVGSRLDIEDSSWIGRQGIALALHSAADILRTKDLPIVMTFLISRALVYSKVLHSILKRMFFFSYFIHVFLFFKSPYTMIFTNLRNLFSIPILVRSLI